MTYLYIFLGGGLGSLARYLTTRGASKLFTSNFPIGTLVSNLVACALLAFLVVFLSSKQQDYLWMKPLLIVGFCGGYSTFSTFSNETYSLIESGHTAIAILNILISLAVGVGLIFLIRSRG